MSTIEKLSIQGIRSFGPNADDCQCINFSSPVTLILGENGCGKTTIIECLKYSITGDFPPGCNHGKSFVHDPKIFHLSETLGQIKVQVRDKKGQRLSVCRSMKVSQRGEKTTFETLDATMNFYESAGGPNIGSISKRVNEVDSAMCDFMGVSKAIINNVIFCHQEDSSWPLDESKKLKERFDAIFDTTEYNKAIDRVCKMHKEQTAELKVLEANLKLLLHIKQDMEDKTLSLMKAQQKHDSIKEQCSICEEEMKPIEARLSEIRKIECEIGNFQSDKVKMETRLKNCIEQISNLSSKIKKIYEGNLYDLEKEIESFGQTMSDKVLERNKVSETLSKLKFNEHEFQKKLTDLDKKICLAQKEHAKEIECNKRLTQKISLLCEQLNIERNDHFLESSNEIDEIIDDITNILMSKECEIAEVNNQFDSDDQKQQMEIDSIRVEVTKSVEGVSALQKQKLAQEKEYNTTETKIGEIEVSVHQLKALTKDIEEIDIRYEKTLKGFNKEASRQEIVTQKNNIAKLQDNFKNIDEKLTYLNSIAKLTAEINLKEKDFDKKEQEVRRLVGKHSDNFAKVFTQPVSENYRRSLQVVSEKLRKDIKLLTDRTTAEKLKEQSYEIKRKSLKNEINRMEKELEESNEIVFQKCHSTPFNDLLARTKTAVSKYQMDHGAFKSAESMYKKFIQKIDEEPCCPLCHKNMSGDEVVDISSELSDEIQKLPENITRTEGLLKAEQAKYESLLQLKPVLEKIEQLEKNIPIVKKELLSIQNDLANSTSQNETLQVSLSDHSIKMDLVNSMLGDMSLLDEAMKDASRVKKDLTELKRKIPEDHSDEISIEALQLEKDATLKNLETERRNLEIRQHNYEKHMDGLNRMREVKNKLKDKQIELQEGVQSLPQLKEKLNELSQLLISTSVEIKEMQSKIQPLKKKLEDVIAEKTRKKEENRKNITKMQQSLEAFKSSNQEIRRLQKEVLQFKKLNLESDIKSYTLSTNDIKEKLKTLTENISSNNLKLEEVKAECLNQESLERDLKDNRELKHLQKQEIDLNQKCESLKSQLKELNFGSVSKEKNDLVVKRDKSTIRKGELLGMLGELNIQIKKLQREMDEPKYKESMKNYRRAHYEVQVTRCLITDAAQHRVALEWSLKKFHAEKMENINRLIREYWRLIYRGSDIDYIQIKTKDDDDEKNSTKATTESKRTYNYRVIQSKNGSEIEMRGRCSAGQRVLASLIIRMALAETFSSNCGVIALDEPTTNLDRANIMSLCDALNRIVEERQAQSSFMLIIITHDEDFISALGKIQSFHRVSRNNECKSVIRRVKVD